MLQTVLITFIQSNSLMMVCTLFKRQRPRYYLVSKWQKLQKKSPKQRVDWNPPILYAVYVRSFWHQVICLRNILNSKNLLYFKLSGTWFVKKLCWGGGAAVDPKLVIFYRYLRALNPIACQEVSGTLEGHHQYVGWRLLNPVKDSLVSYNLMSNKWRPRYWRQWNEYMSKVNNKPFL